MTQEYRVSRRALTVSFFAGVVFFLFCFLPGVYLDTQIDPDSYLFRILLGLAGISLFPLVFISTRFVFSVDSNKISQKFKFFIKTSKTIEAHNLEGLNISQDPFGRLFNYGRIVVTGTGGKKIGTVAIDNVHLVAEDIRRINPKLGIEGSKTYQSEVSNIPSNANELEKLSQLLEKGLLTREEFDSQKRKLLG
jgi:hypothetical protein